MKLSLSSLLSLLFTMGAVATASAQVPTFVPTSVVDEARQSFIFIFNQGVSRTESERQAHALISREGGKLRHIYATAVKGFSASLPLAAAQRIADSPLIRYYEPNGIAWAIGFTPNKKPATRGPPSSSGSAAAQVTPPGISRVGGPLDGSGKDAWVIDTGIDTSHPDLKLGVGANFVLRGKDTINDGNGHGTHVAGTIGAIDNAIDVVGVAAGATVHPVRVLDNSGSGTIDGVIAGVDYVAATATTGDVANLSLGASGHFQSLHDAIVNAAATGIRFAIAAGNSASYAMDYEPAHIDAPNVYTVSAIDADDRLASFSNWGNPPIDYAAPGVAILSTKKGGGTTTLSGTSMASPHVAALLLFATPQADGYAMNDPDGIPDPIAHH
jgi:subtilisin family serine protease